MCGGNDVMAYMHANMHSCTCIERLLLGEIRSVLQVRNPGIFGSLFGGARWDSWISNRSGLTLLHQFYNWQIEKLAVVSKLNTILCNSVTMGDLRLFS